MVYTLVSKTRQKWMRVRLPPTVQIYKNGVDYRKMAVSHKD